MPRFYADAPLTLTNRESFLSLATCNGINLLHRGAPLQVRRWAAADFYEFGARYRQEGDLRRVAEAFARTTEEANAIATYLVMFAK